MSEQKREKAIITVERFDAEGNSIKLDRYDDPTIIMMVLEPEQKDPNRISVNGLISGTVRDLKPMARNLKEEMEKRRLLGSSLLDDMLRGLFEGEDAHEHDCEDCNGKDECDLPQAVEYRAGLNEKLS